MDPEFLSKYYLFEWVNPLPADGMYALFALLAIAAFCIMIGLWYRIATVLFFVGFTYMFLLDASRYLNHFYLVSLVSFLLIFVPAHRNGSMDAKFYPGLRTDTVPAWSLWIILFQLGIAYFFAGVAKITPDWLQGEPIGQWLRDRTDLPIIGGLFHWDWAGYLFAYGGLLLDLFIIPLLLIKRTRPCAFIAGLTFHLLNAVLFQIGIFPWFMLGASLIFFPAPHFRRWLTRFGILPKAVASNVEQQHFALSSLGYAGLVVFAAWQILFPLRHFLYNSNPSWSDEGHRFSWHMKLRDKESEFNLVATSKDSTWLIDSKRILLKHQYGKIASTPDLLVEFAQYIGKGFIESGHPDVVIKVKAVASLNGRKPQFLLDTGRNLMTIERSLMQADWIEPIIYPLPPLEERHSIGEYE